MLSTSNNVDLQEIQKFEQVSADWWNPNGAFKPLHDINPVRLSFITQQVNLKNKKVLDVGCGGGILTESLAKQGANATGIDVSESALSAARQHAAQQGISVNYESIMVEDLAKTNAGEFDVVTCMELLEHVPDPTSVVTACAQLVKPHGHVFFSTINRNPKSFLFAIIAAEYLLKLIPKGTHHYEKLIRPAELAAWARAADLEIAQIMGMTYNPLMREYKLTSRTDVNYLMYCKK